MNKKILGIVSITVFLLSIAGFARTAGLTDRVGNRKNNRTSQKKVTEISIVNRTGPKVIKKNQSYIGEERAKAIALSRVKGANKSHLRKIKFDYEDGRPVYEGEIRYNGWEYEFDIDAVTGKIVKWERDRD